MSSDSLTERTCAQYEELAPYRPHSYQYRWKQSKSRPIRALFVW